MGPSSNLPIMPYPAFQIGRYEAVATEIVDTTKAINAAQNTSTISEDSNARSEPTRLAVMDNISSAGAVDSQEAVSNAPSIALTQSLEQTTLKGDKTLDIYT
ncbi:hypothetical protein DES40_2043 [Litorimonas taeanensis]|uniref:Uncharacterized protein n=1 Tax=Litorimonas taeanensis TaxID=568099 RepID=A0A420WDY9_9PROT|nr:hypothetical protein [Litorimonas taeanensis]RKQ69244.1 hypothetical protein DES40_2043 [Litorimonas taeanensis]